MTEACAMWRGDIGAYIVGALDAEASARVRRHLRACRSCRNDYHDLVPVRDWLGWLVLAAEPDTGGRPGSPPLEPVRSLRGHVCGRLRRRWLPRPLPPRRAGSRSEEPMMSCGGGTGCRDVGRPGSPGRPPGGGSAAGRPAGSRAVPAGCGYAPYPRRQHRSHPEQ